MNYKMICGSKYHNLAFNGCGRRGVVGAAPYTRYGGAAGNVGAGALDGPERSE